MHMSCDCSHNNFMTLLRSRNWVSDGVGDRTASDGQMADWSWPTIHCKAIVLCVPHHTLLMLICFLQSFVPTIIFTAIVPRFLATYQTRAQKLTQWENHKHQSSFDSSLTIKTFALSSVVAYLGLALSRFHLYSLWRDCHEHRSTFYHHLYHPLPLLPLLSFIQPKKVAMHSLCVTREQQAPSLIVRVSRVRCSHSRSQTRRPTSSSKSAFPSSRVRLPLSARVNFDLPCLVQAPATRRKSVSGLRTIRMQLRATNANSLSAYGGKYPSLSMSSLRTTTRWLTSLATSRSGRLSGPSHPVSNRSLCSSFPRLP